MRTARWFGLIAAMGLSFAAGALWQVWHARELMKANPCTITYWSPGAKTFLRLLIDDRACVKLGPEREYSGTWTDSPYRGFIPDRPEAW